MLFDDLGKTLILFSPDGAPSGPLPGAPEDGADQVAKTDDILEDESGNDDLKLDGEFDAERAKRTILGQRDSERKLKSQLKSANEELEKYKLAESKAEEAKKTELEKLASRAEKAERSLQEAQELVQGMRLQMAFNSLANETGLIFASQQAADDAFDLMDLDGVEIDGNGNVKGLKKALEKLAESRPYLFSSNGSTASLGTPKRDRVQKPTPTPAIDESNRSKSLVKL